jgi:hypothetical protein
VILVLNPQHAFFTFTLHRFVSTPSPRIKSFSFAHIWLPTRVCRLQTNAVCACVYMYFSNKLALFVAQIICEEAQPLIIIKCALQTKSLSLEFHKAPSVDILANCVFCVAVVVVCANQTTVREILLAAEELNMVGSGEYVFFNIELYRQVN